MSKNNTRITNLNTAVLAFALIANTGCKGITSGVETTTVPNNAAGVTGQPGLAVQPATAAECAAGGFKYTVFTDFNKNGTRDEGEPESSSQLVCNGANGESGEDGTDGRDGYSTLFSVNRVSLGLGACASGAGLQINAGLDINRSGALDADEIETAQILCDGPEGVAGAPGAGGAPGSDGLSVAFQVAFASTEQCSAGGTLVLMALDANHNGVVDSGDRDLSSAAICNGANGTNGSNGTNGTNAPVAYSPVDIIVPCGESVAYREVLLRLGNGQVLASFSDNAQGAYTRFVLLPDGSYQTTDHAACTFTLATAGALRSVSWGGQVRATWAMP